tara:strand:+ start:28815 stop:29417 length:603 start_codon:yes stop_codon:yes gene_type:complete
MKLRKDGKLSILGGKTTLFSKELYDRIRKRLNLLESQLSDKDIKNVINLGNKELAQFIINNAEGFMLNDMGTIAPSKHLPKELREDKGDILEKIQNIKVSDLRRHQLMKRYDVDIGRRIDINKLNELGEKIPHLNLNSYFYAYRIMWFNHRNTKTKKGMAYEFIPSRQLNRAFYDKIWEGKDYYEWTFEKFYKKKQKNEY